MWSGNLAPDHADLGAADLLLATVDEGDLLAEVEVGSVCAVNTLDLDQAGARVGDVTRALVAQVTSPMIISVSQRSVSFGSGSSSREISRRNVFRDVTRRFSLEPRRHRPPPIPSLRFPPLSAAIRNSRSDLLT